MWDKQGNQRANTVALRNILGEDGITLDETIFNQIADVGGDFTDALQEFSHMGKVFIYSLGGIVLVGLGLLVFNIARNPGQVAGTVIKYTK